MFYFRGKIKYYPEAIEKLIGESRVVTPKYIIASGWGKMFSTRCIMRNEEGRILSNGDDIRQAILVAARDGVSLRGAICHFNGAIGQEELEDLYLCGVKRYYGQLAKEGLDVYGISIQSPRNRGDACHLFPNHKCDRICLDHYIGECEGGRKE